MLDGGIIGRILKEREDRRERREVKGEMLERRG